MLELSDYLKFDVTREGAHGMQPQFVENEGDGGREVRIGGVDGERDPYQSDGDDMMEVYLERDENAEWRKIVATLL